MSTAPKLGFFQEYWVDARQRSILTLDTLRERGNTYFDQAAKEAPNVLGFEVELVRDGRTLPQPVNYVLVRVVPPDGMVIDPVKPPFVVVDPRAGHGPGIGGMKHDSEIGVALAAGHACYFVGFLPEPVPGQTIEHVCVAEAAFLEEVAKRHPDAESKPVIVANCQAGWQIMMMAAIRPDLCGPLMLAGSPLSYWHMAHRPGRRSRQRDLRWGEPGRQFRIAQSRQHLLAEAVQSLLEGRHGDVAVPRFRDLVGQSGPSQCRRNAVDCRQSVRRQQADIG